MGSFSFTRADNTTKRKNLVCGDKYKILVPMEFGGGSITDTYYDYGEVFAHESNEDRQVADLYGILAYWNKCENMTYLGEDYPETMIDILTRGQTTLQSNRIKGIDIGCYKYEIDKLKYPLKLVSLSYNGTYEDCIGKSYGDPEQGFCKTYWEKDEYENQFGYKWMNKNFR